MHLKTNTQAIRCVLKRRSVYVSRFLDFIVELAVLCLLVNSKINTPAPHHQLPKPPISKNRVCVARGGCFAAVYSLGGMDLLAIENQ